jgi:ParE toxin of type II toxin-antitoxin system, parDE
MAEYRLTDRARADLVDIYDFTEDKFGAYQAEAYYAGLIRTFGLLADFRASVSLLMNSPQVIDASAFKRTSSSIAKSQILSKSARSFTAHKTSGHSSSNRGRFRIE